MNKLSLFLILALLSMNFKTFAQLSSDAPKVKTVNGVIEGTDDSGVKIFKGIPFAAPPVGLLRWKEPQPVTNWDGVRKADKFGDRPMQKQLYSDMIFLSEKVSEDCLYLNVWTPAVKGTEKLPVLVLSLI